MNMEAIRDDFVSKPKVNRLPLSSVREKGSELSSDNYVIWRSLWVFVAVALLTVAFVGYQYGMVSSETSTLSPDDVRLMALVNSSDNVAKRNESSIYLHDDGGVIVGQMVKVDSESEKATSNEVAAVNTGSTGGELLAILSKD